MFEPIEVYMTDQDFCDYVERCIHNANILCEGDLPISAIHEHRDVVIEAYGFVSKMSSDDPEVEKWLRISEGNIFSIMTQLKTYEDEIVDLPF